VFTLRQNVISGSVPTPQTSSTASTAKNGLRSGTALKWSIQCLTLWVIVSGCSIIQQNHQAGMLILTGSEQITSDDSIIWKNSGIIDFLFELLEL
jgi:hypothetical protein